MELASAEGGDLKMNVSFTFPDMTRILSLLLVLSFAPPLRAESGLKILLVVGSGGTDSYLAEFAETSAIWIEAAKRGGAELEILGLDLKAEGAPDDAELLKTALASEESPELWLVLIGHGTFDQREVKFNLRGPDVTDRELAEWLEAYPGQLAVINTASASGSYAKWIADVSM